MVQNTSTAVMQRRVAGTDSLDFYPTPPWGTRALCEWLSRQYGLSALSAWDPACGEHDMVKPLREYFGAVYATDIAPHRGGHRCEDFLASEGEADFVIVNPPFKLAEEFILHALKQARRGVAVLARNSFFETIGRHERLFARRPPTDILQFVERLVMHHGKLSKDGSTATSYSWMVWRKGIEQRTIFDWIAPCRARLERTWDYP